MYSVNWLTVDDAYISFRYARNLVEGHGLVYNPGERVEGYTNFLWTLLIAGGLLLGIGAELCSKVLGALSALLAVYGVYRFALRLQPASPVPPLAPWLLAGSLVFMGYAIQGLETAFFAALLVAGAARLWTEELEGKAVVGSAVLFALAGLTRPEAPMYLGLLMLMLPGRALLGVRALAASRWRQPLLLLGLCLVTAAGLALLLQLQTTADVAISAALAALLVLSGGLVAVTLPAALLSGRNLLRGILFLLPLAAHLIWRHHYYGAWLPNTLTAKTGDEAGQLLAGLGYLLDYLRHDGLLAALALCGIGLAAARRDPVLLSVATVCVVAAGYVVLVGGDWMPLFRFVTPIIPFYLLLADSVLRTLMGARTLLPRLAGVAALTVVALQMVQQFGTDYDRFRAFALEWDRHAGRTATWFAEREATLGREQVAGTIALGDIGEVGYVTGYPVLDLLGLVDTTIADLPGGYTNKVGQGFLDYVHERRPRYVVIISEEYGCRSPSVTSSRALYDDPRFRRTYRVAGQVWAGQDHFWCIYQDLERALPGDLAPPEPLAPEIARSLAQGFTELPDTDLWGGDIDALRIPLGQDLIAQCQRACEANVHCRAYTVGMENPQNPALQRMCWIKDASHNMAPSPYFRSGVRLL
jgi:hypothetical protein